MAAASERKGMDKPSTPESWSLNDRGKKAEMKIKLNPYDLESWGILLKEAQSASSIRARMMYEKLVQQFPTSVRYWRAYIEHELRQKHFEQVEKLFERCLMKILHVDLWRCYISYIRDHKISQANYREKMRQAYEFSLDHVGIDFYSTPLWLDYIEFLQQETAQGSYAENLKTQVTRRAYQQALVTPKMGIEQLWKDYNGFEQAVNAMTAKKLIDSQSRLYICAKKATYEYESTTRGLIKGATSTLPTGSLQETQQLQIWKRYIAWEKQNPLRSDDKYLVIKRGLAYNHCLLCFGMCPDIWCEAAYYLQRCSTESPTDSKSLLEEAAGFYTNAIEGPMRTNLLVNFAFADFEESCLHASKAEAIYTQLLDNVKDPTLVYIQYMKFARRTGGIKAARTVFKQARDNSACDYQVYVAAALMEYYITKDKDIAFRIFELGMKKFSNNNGFILAYVDHLSHLTEDNNTRVLLEKGLSNVPFDLTLELWEKFTEFEASVGELSSLMKVERRRAAALKALGEECSDSVLLVDRYKYLDLLPCTFIELRVMGHPSVCNAAASTPTTTNVKVKLAPTPKLPISITKDSDHMRPDIKQMLPFKPSTSIGVGMNAIPGGHFPLPSAVAHVLSLLPPPSCFQGPFVKVDELTELIMTSPVPDLASTPSGMTMTNLSLKRPRDDEEGGDRGVPPNKDIYIARQQKRPHVT